MINQLKQNFTADQVEKFKAIFIYHDQGMKGRVNSEDLPFMLRASGTLISDREIQDLQIKGKVSEEEFYKLLIKLKDKRPIKSEIEASIKVFDQKDTGLVDTKELMGIVQQMGDEKVEKEFSLILNKLSNQEHQVPINSLINLLLKE